MKSEIEKMRSGELANMLDPQIQASFRHAKSLLAQFNQLSVYSDNYRDLLKDLIPDIPSTSTIMPPFHCDHGHGIHLGEHVFVNAFCTFLDGGNISIGDHTLVGPSVQIYTPQHPMGYRERRIPQEYSLPVSIGEDCWLGGSVVILPGIKIGDRCVIGAGSVVTHDVPDDSVVAGNPARVIRTNKA